MKPTIDKVLPLVRAYVNGLRGGAGGALHVWLEDSNIDDGAIRVCIEWATERGDQEALVIAELALQMSKTQRLKISKRCWRKA